MDASGRRFGLVVHLKSTLPYAVPEGAVVFEAARLGLAAGVANAQVPGAGELDPSAIPRAPEAISPVAV